MLVPADVHEPSWDRRVPGTVLWAEVGDTMAIQGKDGTPQRRHPPRPQLDLPVHREPDTVGVWAFHDQHQQVQRWINRGLFGALIVRDPLALPVDHEIPLFVHQLAGGDVAQDGFESPTLGCGAQYAHTLGTVAQTYPYHCKIYGVTMSGTVTVQNGAPATANVVIGDTKRRPSDAKWIQLA